MQPMLVRDAKLVSQGVRSEEKLCSPKGSRQVNTYMPTSTVVTVQEQGCHRGPGDQFGKSQVR
jgi:hypothetical protein